MCNLAFTWAKNTNPAGSKRLVQNKHTSREIKSSDSLECLQSKEDLTFQNRGQIYIISELKNVLHNSRLCKTCPNQKKIIWKDHYLAVSLPCLIPEVNITKPPLFLKNRRDQEIILLETFLRIQDYTKNFGISVSHLLKIC